MYKININTNNWYPTIFFPEADKRIMKSYGVTRLKIEVYVEIKHVQKYKSSEN